MKLTFWGAARQVTGSMTLLEIKDQQAGTLNLLIDCGTSMENNASVDEQPGKFVNNSEQLFPFEPSQVHAVILTHAHIDHSGQIPNLIREGFEGKIICSEPTYDLVRLLLDDAAGINQRKVKKLYKRRSKDKSKADILSYKISKLYMPRHVDESLDFFTPIPCDKYFPLNEQVSLKLNTTGHLLGACNIILEVTEDGQKKSICFSGDIGRNDYPLLKDPSPVPKVDYLISEATYGNRRHQAEGSPEDILFDVINTACIEKRGRLIIPAFSVGRTQALLFTLNKLYEAGRLPHLKIFSDSPLALKSTQVYERFYKELNQEAIDFMREKKLLFDFENLEIIESSQQSKAISNYDQPCIIISSSGMISGGRIENHVYKNLQNKNSTIFFIGYCAEGTLGHQLINGAETIAVKDNEINVKCNIVQTDVFSGHGDKDDLLNFARQQDPRQLRQFFLIHGDYEAMEDYKKALEDMDFNQVTIPQTGDSFEL